MRENFIFTQSVGARTKMQISVQIRVVCVICVLFIHAYPQSRTLSNANNWSYWVYENGTMGVDPDGNAGGIYPRGTAGAIYEDGFIWGGFVRGAGDPELRVGGHMYRSGIQPGWINEDGSAVDRTDPRARIYRIRHDIDRVSDEKLRREAGEQLYSGDESQVTDSDIESIREQYQIDWDEWPVDLGAPFIDINNNNMWDIGIDKPGILNATQVIWFVANDLATNLATDLAGSPSIGLEYQVTLWSWAIEGNAAWPGQTIYQRHRLINKSQFQLDSVYVGRLSDPDVGSHTNDLVGCDTVLQLAYAYNDHITDPAYDVFGQVPPVVGQVLLQGPTVPDPDSISVFDFRFLQGRRNLKLSSFAYTAAGSPCGGPPLGIYNKTLSYYDALNGYTWYCDTHGQHPFIAGSGPSAGQATVFPLSGDPVTDPAGVFGDVDGQGNNLGSSDRRYFLSTGPFNMAPGDTQEVVFALVGGIDPDGSNLTSITRLKENVAAVREHYGQFLATQQTHFNQRDSANSEFVVETDLYLYENVASVTAVLRPSIGNEAQVTISLWDNGTNGDSLANDGLWSAVKNVVNRKYPFTGDLILGFADGTEQITRDVFHEVRLRPQPRLVNWRLHWERGRQDEQFNNNETAYLAFDIDNRDAVNAISETAIGTFPLRASQYIAKTLAEILPLASYTDDSTFVVLTAPFSRDMIEFEVELEFDEHRVSQEHSYPIVGWTPSPIWQDTIGLIEIIGTSENVVATIADGVELTGNQYALRFRESVDKNIEWQLLDLSDAEIAHDWQQISNHEFDTHTIVDGIQYRVTDNSKTPNFASFEVVSNAGGKLEAPTSAGMSWQGFPTPLDEDGFPTNPSYEQQFGEGQWAVHTADNGKRSAYGNPNSSSGQNFLGQTTRDGELWEHIIPDDYEIRFTEDGSWAWDYHHTGAFIEVPFELWNIGSGSPDDHSDDFRMIPYLLDDDASGEFNMPLWGTRSFGSDEHSGSSADNDPYTDWIYWHRPHGPGEEPVPGEEAYQLVADSMAAGSFTGGSTQEVMARMVLVNWNGDIGDPLGAGGFSQDLPEPGTIFRIVTSKPNYDGDSLLLQAPSADSTNFFPKRTTLFQNYPNPFNATTTINFEINHKMNVNLTIYDILGRRVKTIVERFLPGGYYEFEWDGTSEAGLPAASGLYIYRLTGFTIAKSEKMLLIR